MYEVEQSQLSGSREQAVLAELERLLDSAAFRTSKRCREFLKYVVEHTIRGPNGTLKERAIGVELFQLPEDFDTGQHTIVRVTANEVRKKLAQHYLAENGSYHPVRIELPPGSYSAEFRWEAPSAEAHAPVRAARRLSRGLIACLAAVIAIACISFLLPSHAIERVTADAKSTPAPNPFPKQFQALRASA